MSTARTGWTLALALAACAGPAPSPVTPVGFALPDDVAVVDAKTGRPLDAGALVRAVGGADLVLLGEVHDNPVHHRLRGALLAASAARRPAVVFEQFAASAAPLGLPQGAGEPLDTWLDQNGFDRTSWRWPLHEPVVSAALRYGRALWGSGMSRETLRVVVRDGAAGAPEDLRAMMDRVPLEGAAQGALDQDLIEGHCGQLPASMITGMRAAQVVRDASMARALMAASAGGPAWLIAGNGHVRGDLAVPRLLKRLAPGKSVLAVGFLERSSDGSPPAAAERERYDIVVVTTRVQRPDPCASLRRE